MNIPPKNLKSFEALVEIMQILRSDTGCPWDKEQTHQSLTSYALEEVCELIDAIESNDTENMKEELGDVLLQVIFHAEIAKADQKFDIYDVLESLNTKLVSRHSHVFTENRIQNTADALANWNASKKKEKELRENLSPGSTQKRHKSIFDIPKHLPGLQYAQKMGEKTKKFHFDWNSVEDVFKHVEEEVLEFKEALHTTPQHLEEEFGDLLFTLVQTARHLKIDSESALRKTNQKVERRWSEMKSLALQKNLHFETLSTEELNQLWVEVKKAEKIAKKT